jgi:hypothetical protein
MSYTKRRRFLWILFLTGIGLVAAVVTSGTTLVALRFGEMTEQATAVARVRCLGARSFMEHGEIWTETRFEVIKSAKGLLAGLVTVRMPGGRADGLRSHVDGVPEFQIGEEMYLFLWGGEGGGYRVLGWTQGTFRIRRDVKSGAESVVQDSAGAVVFDPATRTFRHEGIREISVARFEEKLRAALTAGR